MSILLAIQTTEQIIIAGDRRLVDKDNNLKSDTAKKVHMINEHLAIASAGNRLGDLVITNLIGKNLESKLYADEAAYIINEYYDDNNILKHIPTCFIIGGMASNEKCGIIDISIGKEKPTMTECQEVLHSPVDLNNKDCQKIYYMYKEKNPKSFYIDTILKVSELSQTVSKSCDVWKFDLNKHIGSLENIF